MTVFDHQLGIKEETTYGTPVTVDRFYEFMPGGGITLEPRVSRSGALRAGRVTQSSDMSVRARPTIGGSFKHHVQTKGFGALAKMIFGSVATAGPTNSRYTHTFTLGEPGKFTLQQGIGRPSAATKAFTATGCKVTSATFSGEIGGLLTCSFDIDARVAWGQATLTGGTTNGSPTVTMASTAGVTLDMPVTGTGIPASTIVGSIINNTSIGLINSSTRAAANATATGSPSLTFGTSLASVSYPSTVEPFLIDFVTVTIGGTAVCAEGFEITMDQSLDVDRVKMCSNGLKDEPIRAGLGTYGLTLSGITYDADTQVDRIIAATAAGAQAQVIITATAATDPTCTCTFTLPACEFEGAFPTMDEGLVEHDMSAVVLTTAAGASPVTLAYVTADATP